MLLHIIGIIVSLIVIVLICYAIYYFFIRSDTDNFVEYDDCDRSVRPWWWYLHMRDNLYYTPDYAFQTIFYDGRPHNKWHHKYRPYNNDHFNYHTHHRSLNGSRHGSRHGPNHGRLRS